MCISWTIKGLISLMHGINMKTKYTCFIHKPLLLYILQTNTTIKAAYFFSLFFYILLIFTSYIHQNYN